MHVYKKRVPGSRWVPGLAFLVSAILLTGNASAQNKNDSVQGEHSAGLAFGQVILAGDFAKQHSDDLGYGLVYNFNASEVFGIYAEYITSTHKDSTGQNVLRIRNYAPYLRMNLSYMDQLTIFGVAGFGLSHISQDIGPAAGSVTSFSFNMGPGIELRLHDHIKFGSLVSFHNVFSKADSEAKNPFSPTGKGMTIGGTYMRLMLNIQYVF